MSRKNVEVVQGIYREWGRGNFREGTELFDHHILLVVRPEFGPASGLYCGPEAIAGYMRDFLAEWDGFVIVSEEFVDAGDSVVACVDQRATGRESGTPVHAEYFQVWTFRGPSVIRIESVAERAEALEAAGLRDRRCRRRTWRWPDPATAEPGFGGVGALVLPSLCETQQALRGAPG